MRFLNYLKLLKMNFRLHWFKLITKCKLQYNVLYEFLTLKLLALVTIMVRKTILLKGKDPNYVAPLPPVKEKPYLNFRLPYTPSWVASSFKDAKNHPLYKGPKTLPMPIQESPLQVTLSDFNSSLIEITEENSKSI